MLIRIKFLLLFLLFSTFLHAEVLFTEDEKKWIKNNPTIKIAMLNDLKPFSFINNNKHQGFSVDLLNKITKISGLKFDKQTSSWTVALDKFKTKKVSMISGISHTKSRESFTNFTEPFYEIPAYIFGLKDNKNNKDLKDKKVAITKNVFYKDKIQNLGMILIEYENSAKKAQAVKRGEVDFFLDSYLTGIQTIENLSLDDVVLIDEFPHIKKEDLRFGINKKQTILYSIIQKSFSSIPTSELINLSNKWMINIQEYRTSTINFTKKEQEYLKNKQQITMCIDPDWMPFEKFDSTGKHVGMSASYFHLFEKNIGIPVKVIHTKTWGESIDFAKQRKCDILSLVMKTPQREEYLNFTSSYMNAPLVVATKPNITYIDNISMLNGKKIGIVKGYAFNEIIKDKYPNITVVDVDNIKEGLQKVVNGELFGFVGTLISVGYQFQTSFTGELKIAGKFDDKWELGIGVRDDDKVLLNILEKAVNTLSEQDKQSILNKHISITYQKGIDYSLIWKILIVVLFFAIFMIYFQKKLHLKVKEKTLELKLLNENLELKIEEEVKKNIEVQQKLFKSKKLASMGEMIGNIAHQWRQPLSIISTGASGMLLQKEYGILTDEQFISTCNGINKNAQYLSKTIDDFRDFIKGDRVKKVFSLEEDIESFLSLVNGSIKTHDINMVLNLEKDINISGYQNELTQCFINIFNNAKDAIKENQSETRLIFISTKKENDKAIIEIKDNGGGIPNDILTKIFEPYFTTKHKSQGTGLGLHMTYTLIVDGMKGHIEVHNTQYKYDGVDYKGARFIITLPIS